MLKPSSGHLSALAETNSTRHRNAAHLFLAANMLSNPSLFKSVIHQSMNKYKWHHYKKNKAQVPSTDGTLGLKRC